VSDSSFGSGWSTGKTAPQYKSSKQTDRFTVSENGEEVLIKFVEESPFLSFFQHWVRQEDGKNHPYAHSGDDCPLCGYGNRAKSVDYMNVLQLGENGEPELKLWMISPDPRSAILERANSKRTSPLNREDLYFAVSKRKQTNNTFSYTVDPVKAADLEDEWGVKPLTAEQIASATTELYDKSVAESQMKSHSELLELAKKYLDD
jgi:hypothetical protein